jgi:beta-galactosidase
MSSLIGRRFLVIGIALLASFASTSAPHAAFPEGFLWGTSISGFQTEMGGNPAHNDPNSDWWVWVRDPDNLSSDGVSGDLPENGPGFFSLYAQDMVMARKRLRTNSFRMGFEWSRIFPTSTEGVDTSGGLSLAVLQQLDALADQSAVARYRDILKSVREQGMSPLVTLVHFTLPIWIHDPIATRDALAGIDPSAPLPPLLEPAGWLDTVVITELEKYAAYVGWKFGDLVDRWVPLNEPVVVGAGGYVNLPGIIGTNFPPGAFTFTGLITVLINEIEGHAAAYDALKAADGVDADGDGSNATVGVVHNMVAFEPSSPSSANDVLGAQHAQYLFNQLFLNSVILGQTDPNADGISDPGEFRADLVGKSDFVGLNYYFRGRILGLGAPITPVLPLFDFLPLTEYRTPQNPTAPTCPSVCTEFGWEIYPRGMEQVLATAGSYGLPVYITENGLADGDDDQRRSYLVRHLQQIEKAITNGVADVRGYHHWSLIDNYEWTSGFYPRFGLISYDPDTLARRPRRSARIYKSIAKRNALTPRLVRRFGVP